MNLRIQITPKHLGEYDRADGTGRQDVSVVSIEICSEKKTMELLAQSAKEIGSVMEQNLGKPTEIYVDEQKSETLWQDGQQDQVIPDGIGAVSAERRTGKNAESREYPVYPGIETGTDR